MTKQILTLTDSAVTQIQTLLAARESAAYGVRIGLKAKGCNGMAYTLEYADAKAPLDEEVVYGDLHVLIDPKAVMFLLGTQMDFRVGELESGFVFTNPNEKGRCGCGESFHV